MIYSSRTVVETATSDRQVGCSLDASAQGVEFAQCFEFLEESSKHIDNLKGLPYDNDLLHKRAFVSDVSAKLNHLPLLFPIHLSLHMP